MMKTTVLFFLLAAGFVSAAEWQWSFPGPGKDGALTFLWIPPECEQVRGVVVGQRNMLEEGVFEHPAFRANLARLGLAERWIVPADDVVFRFGQGAGETIETMLNQFASTSGYGELQTAPVIPMGHSACASFPWNFTAWQPERTLAVPSIKGPDNLPRWTGLPFESPLTHATGGGSIQVDRICGPVRKIKDDTFQIKLDRTFAAQDRRNFDVWLRAWRPGGREHKSMVQQASLVEQTFYILK